jgi:prepilin-type N-terminal cleavage/methylation domain-containing protein
MRLRLSSLRHGFSLVELAIVVMMIGIAASVAIPSYFYALARGRIDAASRRIVADLEMAQTSAEITSSSQTVQFSSANNSYVLTGIDDFDHPTLDYTVKLGATPYMCNIVSANFSGSEQLQFNGFGIPVAGGTITLGCGNLQRSIVVDPLSGKGEIQ